MAKYRQIHTTFWDDGFVIDLTPEEKYFYLYLMTNNNTTQCGIYELPYRVIEMQTGYNRDTVIKLLDRFKEYGKILYNEGTKEIMLLNWARYNFINSPKVKKCIEKELTLVKHLPFVEAYHIALKQYGYSLDTVSKSMNDKNSSKEPNSSNEAGSIPYPYPINSLSIDLGEEEEKEKEKEEEKEEEKEKEKGASPRASSSYPSPIENDFKIVLDFFEQRFRAATHQDNSDLNKLYEFYPDGRLIIEAMKIALQNEKPFISYFQKILYNWAVEKAIHTYQDFLQKGGYSGGSNSKRNEQRDNAEYDGLSL